MPTALLPSDLLPGPLLDVLVPALGQERLSALLAPLVAQAEPDDVLAVAPGVVPAGQLVAAVRLPKGQGFTSMEDADVARFAPTVELPAAPLYLLRGVDAGEATRGVRPDDALPRLLAQGRSPLTLEEGLSLAVRHPRWLRERTCFEMLGSRCGDKRVTGVWVSAGRPRLGWCWGGNPHTWLGMASALTRVSEGAQAATRPGSAGQRAVTA